MWGLCWGGLGGECSRCCAVQVLRWWVWGSPGGCFGGIEGLWAGLPLGGAGGGVGMVAEDALDGLYVPVVRR